MTDAIKRLIKWVTDYVKSAIESSKPNISTTRVEMPYTLMGKKVYSICVPLVVPTTAFTKIDGVFSVQYTLDTTDATIISDFNTMVDEGNVISATLFVGSLRFSTYPLLFPTSGSTGSKGVIYGSAYTDVNPDGELYNIATNAKMYAQITYVTENLF